MIKTIDGKDYELVKTKVTGCAKCVFTDNSELCEKAGEDCMKKNHRNDYPMVWKEVGND